MAAHSQGGRQQRNATLSNASAKRQMTHTHRHTTTPYTLKHTPETHRQTHTHTHTYTYTLKHTKNTHTYICGLDVSVRLMTSAAMGPELYNI